MLYSPCLTDTTSMFVFKEDKTAEDLILYSSIVKKHRSLCNIDIILKYIKDHINNVLSFKALMKVSKVGNFYKLRTLIDELINSGLVIALSNYDIKNQKPGSLLYLYPYFYTGEDKLYICIRHLLSLGYRVYRSDTVDIIAIFNDKRYFININADLDSFAQLINDEEKILITEKPQVNFSKIKNYSLSEFLELTKFD